MGVTILKPAGAITPTGPWSVGARAGDFVFVAGMRGIEPGTNQLIEGEEARVRQAFRNMMMVAGSQGATAADCVRTVVYVTDMARHRPLANAGAEELWGTGPYPPRTIIEVKALNQGDFFEIDGTFYVPAKR